MKPQNIILISFTKVVDVAGNVAKGSAEVYAFELAKLAVSLGHVVNVLQFDLTPSKFTVMDINVTTCQWSSSLIARRPRKLVLDYLSSFDATSTIVIFCSEAVVVRADDFYTIMIQHKIGFDYPPSGKSLSILRHFKSGRYAHWLLRQGVLRAANSVDCTVCVDYVYPTWLKTICYVPPCRVLTIPNFSRVCERDIPPRESYSRVLFARRMVTRRGCWIMASATRLLLAKYPRLCVTFAGEGPEKRAMVEMFSGELRVKFIEYENEDALRINATHDIAVIPSLASEGTSLSLLEAMAAKCAVVAAPVGGISNIVIDNHNGLVCEPTAESIAAKVALLHTNPALAMRLSACGYSTVLESFSYTRWCRLWAGILGENKSRVRAHQEVFSYDCPLLNSLRSEQRCESAQRNGVSKIAVIFACKTRRV